MSPFVIEILPLHTLFVVRAYRNGSHIKQRSVTEDSAYMWDNMEKRTQYFKDIKQLLILQRYSIMIIIIMTLAKHFLLLEQIRTLNFCFSDTRFHTSRHLDHSFRTHG